MFGGSKPFGSTSSTFGSTGSSLFGQTNKPAGSSLFGASPQQQQQSSSLFGQKPATSSIFGSTAPAQSSSLFGSSSTPAGGSSLFGSQNKPSLFGSSTPASTFGSPAAGSTSMFGSTSATSGGLFGSSGSTTTGTAVKFDPVIASDTMMKNGVSQNISTKHMCITAMKAYENKSLEELRVEDYIANRKAPQAGSTGGLFGSTSTANTSGGLFGSTASQPKNIFGSSGATSSPFGAATTGTTGSSLFGGGQQQQQQQQSSSLFGAKPATGGLFGSPAASSSFGTAPTQSSSLFGNTTQTATFGQAATGTSLFGGTPAPTFGATATSQPSSGFSFGGATSAAPTFGSTTTGGGLFGSTTQQSGGLFGAKPATGGGFSFGSQPAAGMATSAGGGLFGSSTAAKPLFGSTTTTGTGLFGSQPAQQAGGLFGSTQPQQQSSLFGSQPAQTFTTSMPSQVAVAAAAPIILGSDVNQRQVERALIEAQLSATPYGDGPLLKWMGKSMEDTEENPNPTSVQRQVKFLASKVNSPGLSVNGSLLHPSMSKPGSTPSSHSPALSKSQMRSPVVIKDLAYSSSSRPPTLGMGLRSSSIVSSGNTSFKKLNSSHAGNSIDTAVEGALSATGNRLQSPSRRQSIKFLDPAVLKEGNTSMSRQLHDPDALPARAHAQTALNSSGNQVPVSHANFASPSDQPAAAAFERERNLRQNQPPKLNLDVTADESMIDSVPRAVVPTESQSSPAQTASPRGNVTFNVETRGSPQVRSPARQSVTSPAGVTLADAEYFSEPSIAAMAEAVKDGWVELPEGLRIGRATYGSVYWPGPVRVKDLVIDQVVVFRHKEVTVYPDESSKPAEGEGLNRPAEVTLERVWPIDKQTKEEIKEPALLVQTGFRERLQRVTARMGAVFKDYRPATGSWVFRVEHFSKYGLPDDDDSEGECMMECEGDRPPSGFAQGDVHNLVQKEKISLKPLFTDHHNHQVSDDDVMNYNGEETVLSVRMTPTNIKSLGGLGGGLMHAHGHEALLDQILEEEIPEKRIKLHDDVQGMLTQCQKLFDRIDTGVTCKKLQLQTVESRPETSITRPFAKSLLSGCSGPVDEAAQKGAVCPVRFSRDFFFTVCKQPGNSAVELVKTQYPEDIDPEYLEDMLEHNIRYSQRITRNQNASTSVKVNHVDVNSEDHAAWIKPTSDFSQLVNSFAETATQCERPREGFVWELCRALFPVEKAQLQETPWIRRRAVADWLKSCLPDFIPKHQKISDTWKTVCGAQLNKLPVDGSRLFNLCALLPICTQQIVKDGIQGQLDFWEKNGLLDMLSEEELNIYLTIVGKSAYSFKKTNGTNKTVNVVEGLHWMQILSLYVWFSAGSRDSLEDCVMRLKEDMRELRTPIPERDLFWELIQLAVDGDHAVEKVLDAAVNFCVDPLDYHVSWHLWSVLRSHGFTANASSEQRLMTLYAEQLFASERIHLAAFVLSHIEDNQCRSAALRDLLMRIAPEACVDDYKRILGVVDLPMKWIASARAVKAHLQGRADSEFELMLEAGELPTAERILATDLGPHNIAASDFDELLYFVELIEAHLKGSRQKICMPNSTLMYIDYVKLRSGSVESDDELLELCDLIEARIERLDFTTPVQRMQRAIISRHLKEVRRSIGGAQSESFMPANVSSQPAVTVAHLAAGDQDMTIVFDD